MHSQKPGQMCKTTVKKCAEAEISKFVKLEVKCLTSLGEDAPLSLLFSVCMYMSCMDVCKHTYIFSTDVSSFVARW